MKLHVKYSLSDFAKPPSGRVNSRPADCVKFKSNRQIYVVQILSDMILFITDNGHLSNRKHVSKD